MCQPGGGREEDVANLLFGKRFAESYMEIKDIGRGGPGEGRWKQKNTCCKFPLVVVILTLDIYSIEHKMIQDNF